MSALTSALVMLAYRLVTPCRQQIDVDHALHLVASPKVLGVIGHEFGSHRNERVQALCLRLPSILSFAVLR